MMLADILRTFIFKWLQRRVVRYDLQSTGERFKHHLVQTAGLACMYKVCCSAVLVPQLRLRQPAQKLHCGMLGMRQSFQIGALGTFACNTQFLALPCRPPNSEVVPLTLHQSPCREYPLPTRDTWVRREEFCINTMPHYPHFLTW